MPRALSKGAKFAVVCDEGTMLPLIAKNDICYIRYVKEIVDGKIMLVKIRRIKKSNNNEIKLVTSKSIQKRVIFIKCLK